MISVPPSPVDAISTSISGEVDYLVVGQGLAGTVLALTLLRAGRQVLVAAGERPALSSRAALGVVNPITGMRFTPSYRFREAIPCAREFYQGWEQTWNARFWHPAPIHRFFSAPREVRRWAERRVEPELRGLIAADFEGTPPHHPWQPHLAGPDLGGITLESGAWLDIPRLLGLARAELIQRQSLVPANFESRAAQVDGAGISWQGVRARRGVILCEGYPGLAENPLLEALPRRSAKGEVLLIRADLPPGEIVQRGVFLVPSGELGLWRAGASYEWADLTDPPTAVGRTSLDATLRRHFRFEWELVDHFAGVRPILTDKLPVLGQLPGQPGYAVLNGLASKGALLAPWAAQTLIRHLEAAAPLPHELDVKRNFPM